MASNNKVPPASLDDRVMFMEMLEKQQQKFDQIDHIANTKGQSKDVFTTNYVNNCSNNSTNANCPSISTSSTVNISPVSTKKSKKKKVHLGVHPVLAVILRALIQVIQMPISENTSGLTMAKENAGKATKITSTAEKVDSDERHITV